jgi:HAE1 family hydrophobic/amphiphilic exporter-1
MNLIRLAIERPIAILSAVLMVLLFGIVSLQTIPIQLTPDVDKPVIEVSTQWPGAAPEEVEREITNRQEEKLKGLDGLSKMMSRSETGGASVTLEFDISTNMDRALLLVANRLDQVSGYPDEADEPTLSTSSAEDNAIAWFMLQALPGNDRPIHTYRDFAEDVVQDRLERVSGIGGSNLYGGGERELQVTVNPESLARYRLTVSAVVQKLREANAAITGGDVDEGKRRYVVRTEGDFESPEDVGAVVLRSETDPITGQVSRVKVSDIADISYGYKDPGAFIRVLGKSGMALNVVRETGANVIETMQGIRAAVRELNEYALPSQGLKLTQVYDETNYIESSIDLVINNIYVGGALAAFVLIVFLRSFRATLVVSLAIPVSVVGSFVAMAALGRSLNVVSLAGIAFAVGMVVDAAIVVLENIYRLYQSGKTRREAAYLGASQVWGAVLVSALTTVMVFIPVLIMKLEIGQLFRDIAVAISVAVVLSLIVAVTVIPALANKLLGDNRGASITMMRLPVIDDIAEGFVKLVTGFVRAVLKSKILAIVTVAVMCGGTGTLAVSFLPKLSYLPEGNQNFVFGMVLPPPGYNLDTTSEIAAGIEETIKPLWASDTLRSIEEEKAWKASGAYKPDPDAPPLMERFFYVATRATTFLGAIAVDEERPSELIPVLQGPVFREPGTYGFVTQPSIFGRATSGTSIDLDISGPDLETIINVALPAFGMISQNLPVSEGFQHRPIPGLELGAPEVRVIPDRTKLADNGVTARELGDSVDAFNDGLRVAEITVEGKRLDLTLKGPTEYVIATQGIDSLPVVTQSGQILLANSLADVIVTSGPTEIRHIERARTITLQIKPPSGMPLEEAMDRLREKVIQPLEAGGLPPGIKIQVSGTADQLTKTWNQMQLDLMMALVIVYLVMAVLFESFVYPLIIMLSVPLAAAGGVGGLKALNVYLSVSGKFQELDMLTLLGFVILIGIVVNNAILLVHQTLYQIREEGMAIHDAIVDATKNRIRPIFMSTLTSVFGMLPLVLFPGAGSELYRGLGSVVVGGLALSAVLTLLIIPPLLSLLVAPLEAWSQRRKQDGETTTADSRPQLAE